MRITLLIIAGFLITAGAGFYHLMQTLRDDGWHKALRGQTSVDEVLRVTKGDRQVEFQPKSV